MRLESHLCLSVVLALSLFGCAAAESTPAGFSATVEDQFGALPPQAPENAAPPENPWSKIKAPSATLAPPLAQAIGSTSAGCLDGGVELPVDGRGYHVMRLSRKRVYGHPTLVRYLKKLGKAVDKRRLGDILIGDLGQARGGPMLTGHASHQNGLDVDIWYLPKRGAYTRKFTPKEREEVSAKSVLGNGGKLSSAFWNARNDAILKVAASFDEVDRIFVDPAIKSGLCKKLKKDRQWLSKLRPWWWHHDHMHVRLKCPKDQPHCKDTVPIPPGDGCDASLDWWFTEEAFQKKKELESRKGPRMMPDLPEACADVLKK